MTTKRAAVNGMRPLVVRTTSLVMVVGLLALGGCRGSTPPPAPPTEDAARIACDRFAARAIQTGDARDAASLSRQAADCYAALQTPAPAS